MTIDERLEALVARHEALAQSVELLHDTVHKTASRVTSLMDMMDSVLRAMKTLAEAVNDHERRIDRLEGRA
ncbi:MAG TPA: hypothetical protein VEF06_01545 [Bryobacteraceae bacterium]|nr:hypothetical protein [Bryobacteraceae bacterium]